MLDVVVSNLGVLYLIIFCNFFAQLLGCDLQRLMINNIYAKHVIALIAVFFLITLLNKDKNITILKAWFYTIGLYLTYFLSTRMKLYYSIPLLLLILIHENIKLYINEKKIEKEYQFVLKYNQYLIILIILAGVLHYLIRQYNDFGSQFNILTFFIGKIQCNIK